MASNLRKLEAAIASKDASPQYWVKGLDTLVHGGGGGLHFFSTHRTVCHRHQGVNSFNTYFFTSALVMSDLLPAVTGCSWLVVECAPLEHWGIKHEAAPDLISGTRRDFVLWQRWFCSGFSFHAASVLLGFAEGGVWAGWTSALVNQIASSSAPQNYDETGQAGLLKDSKTLGTLGFSLNLKRSKHKDESELNFFIVKFLFP